MRLDDLYFSGMVLNIVLDTSDVPPGTLINIEYGGFPYETTVWTQLMWGESKFTLLPEFDLTSCTIGIRFRIQGESWSNKYTITTPDASGYPSTKLPSYYPQVTDQWVFNRFTNNWHGEAGSCVANSLATVKEIHEYMEGKGSYNQYSIGWIYGNRASSHQQTEGMQYEEALSKLQSDGVPKYDLLPENANYMYGDYYYPDVYYYTNSSPTGVTAKQLVENNYSNLIEYAKPQRIASYSSYSDWEVSPVKERVLEDGCVWLVLDLYDNFYDNAWNNGGIIPQFKSGSFVDGHSVVIIGWRRFNNIWYWICQNSWGDHCGDNGLLYIPFYHDYPRNYYFIRDGNYPYPITSFDWDTPKVSGSDFNVTAIEWSKFQNAINYKRNLFGLDNYPFTSATKGMSFTRDIFKETVYAIDDIYTVKGTTSQVAPECRNVQVGGTVYAWYFENLKQALNNA